MDFLPKTFPIGVFEMKNVNGSEYHIFKSAWLAGVSSEAISDLKSICRFVEIGDGDPIYSIGGPQKWLWGVAKGQVQVRVALIEVEPVLGHIHHEGAWFGESEPLLTTEGLVEMRANGPTVLGKVPYEQFKKLATHYSELFEALARLASMNQLLAMSAANDLILPSSRQRLAATLLRLGGRRASLQGGKSVDEIMATQRDVAGLSKVSMSKASEHLGAMAQDGLIKLEYGRVVLLDIEGLNRVIAG